MGDSYTFIDCPGSVEFAHDMRAALPAVDAAVVVCEMDEKKIPQLQLILRELEDQKIPHFLFLNKIDKADATIHDALRLLQPASRNKLLLRQIPDLRRRASSPASSISRSSAPLSTRSTRRPKSCRSKATRSIAEKTARFSMLETLADHDDELMEQLLEDIQPPRDKVFDDLAKELRDGLVCPVLMGSAARTNGVLRLLKALRHEAPDVATTAKRLGLKPTADAIAYVMKTHAHRAWRQDVDRARAQRPGRRRHHLPGARARGRPRRRRVQAARPEHREARSGCRRRDGRARQARPCQYRRHAHRRQAGAPAACHRSTPLPPVLAIAVSAKERKDDVKLGQALHKLVEEDPRSSVVHNPEAHEVVAWGQGEMHLRVATERLADRFGVVDQHRQADRRLSRDHQEGRRPARPPQEAVGRPRPVRRCRARHQAAAARRRLRLRGRDQGRRGAAQLHSIGGGGRRSTASSTGRSASRWSTSR